MPGERVTAGGDHLQKQLPSTEPDIEHPLPSINPFEFPRPFEVFEGGCF